MSQPPDHLPAQPSPQPTPPLHPATPRPRHTSTLARTLTSHTLQFWQRMQLGRIFRRLGLPFWTFLGIGIAGWWFDNANTLLQALLQHLLTPGDPITSADILPALITFLIPFAVVLGIGTWQASRRQLNQAGVFRHGLEHPTGKKVLILLVSKLESAQFAIDYHYRQQQTLEQVWLVPSGDRNTDCFGASSYPTAQAIQQHCQTLITQHGTPLDVQFTDSVSPADAQDTFDQVNRIYRRSPYSPTEIIADFTGGTKPMTVGMIMACLPAQRQLEYIAYTSGKGSSGPFLVDYQHSAFDLVG